MTTSHRPSQPWRRLLVAATGMSVVSVAMLGAFAVRIVTSEQLHVKVQCRRGLGLPGDDRLARSTNGRLAGGVWVDDSPVGLLLTDHRAGLGCDDARGRRLLQMVGAAAVAATAALLAARTWPRRALLGFGLLAGLVSGLLAWAAAGDGPVLPNGLAAVAGAMVAAGAWAQARSSLRRRA